MMMMANNNSGEAKGGSSAGNAQPNEAAGGGGGGSGGGEESGSDGGGGGGSANASTGDNEVNIRRGLDVIQSMIDISADRLEGLRTQCATSAELTQQEIRTLETKLVKLFSDLLITKSKLPERLPARGLPATGNELKQWLRVVGLSCASLNAVIQQVSTLEGLLEKDDKELRTIMGNNVYVREEEIKRLTRASGNLKRYREQLEAVAGGRKVNAGDAMHDLFWDSWDRQPACHRTSPRVNRSLAGAKCNKPNVNYRHNNGPPMAAVPSGGEFHADQHITSPQSEESMQQHHEQLLNPHHTISPDEASTSGCTPSPSPPNSPSSVMLHGKQQQQQNRKGFPTTPPPKRKHQTALLTSSSSSSASSASTVTGTATVTTTQSAGAVAACAGGTNPADAASAAALTKSKSHESQFGGGGGGGAAGANNNHAVNNNNNNNNNGSSAGPGGGANNNPLYLVNNNNNIPTHVVPLGSNHETGGPAVVTSTTTTTPGNNILSESGTLMAANQRPMGNGSAGNRMGTFPRSRLHTEPTITSSNTMVSPSGGTTQPDHLSHPPQHHHHHHPHHHHHLHHGAPHHHPPSYHHHLQQQATSGGQSEGGEYGAGDGPPIIGHSSVPPKSPCTPIITRGMGHMIQHRFTKKFKVTKSTCDLCNKQMFFGYKCTECKYRCHRDCMQNVPPSCGLPQEFVDEFKKSLQSDTLLPTSVSPNIGRPPGGGTIPGAGGGGMMYVASARAGTLVRGPMHAIHACGGPDSSSAGSSCNSSSPSSPALLSLPPQTPGTSRQFNFPEVPNGQGVAGGSMMMVSTISTTGGSSLIASGGGGSLGSGGITIETHPIGVSSGGGVHAVRSVGSSGYGGDSGATIEIPTLQFSDIPDHGAVLGGENDKTGSASATSTDSSSDRTPIRLDSTEERDHESSWRQNSLSKEWDIPYDDLHLKEKIGNGRFGTVHRALWHGDVAVKLLKEDYVAGDPTLEAFKLEVATFKKTRHENVVLFMGACMNPPRLAIVTSLCKGNTLFTHIHLRKDKFNLNRTTLVAQQISQGMGYLHARGIVHKDLKTKNIFLENGKVIITDFGLFSATKLLYCELGLGIPSGWLCYLAPELMCNLTAYRPVEGDLPFTPASDIYAFGTVWYELLCGEFPFKSQPAESIIWQVGRGMKQTLANLQASRDVKDILIKCWNYHADDRPDFAKLLNLLERLPKKRLARSPSHPVQLSRSAESVF
ncbi:cyclin-dependent kinase 12 [Anopheles bellator]|uniref:cyclin-dependent kinase 12 n=1 Tax=Anopheles bellator TaxID=139047 RepID=UPI0026494566|nr:cyclin-dependent kinase 12 [Anopheles bellator]